MAWSRIYRAAMVSATNQAAKLNYKNNKVALFEAEKVSTQTERSCCWHGEVFLTFEPRLCYTTTTATAAAASATVLLYLAADN